MQIHLKYHLKIKQINNNVSIITRQTTRKSSGETLNSYLRNPSVQNEIQLLQCSGK